MKSFHYHLSSALHSACRNTAIDTIHPAVYSFFHSKSSLRKMITILQLTCVALLALTVLSAKGPVDYEPKTDGTTDPCLIRKCEKVCEPRCQAASSLRLEEKCTTDENGKRVCKNVPIIEKTSSCKQVCEIKCTTVPGTCL